MTLKDQEREIAKLNYELVKKEVEKEIGDALHVLKEKASSGVWLHDIELLDIFYEHIFLCNKEVAVFCKYDMELTDPLLWKELKKTYDVFIECIDGVKKENLSFYALLNSPITQKVYYGLFNPQSEFVVPIGNLEDSFIAELEQRDPVYSEDELLLLLSHIDSMSEGVMPDEEGVYSDETGNYIEIRGKLKRRSDIDPEKYFWLTLFGGFLGLHKFYAKCYGSFIAYLFTLGFVGVGWMVDLAEICMKISKDRKKAYIGPFEEVQSKRIICLIVATIYTAFAVVMIFVS